MLLFQKHVSHRRHLSNVNCSFATSCNIHVKNMFHTCHIYDMSTIHLLLNVTFMSEACSTQGKIYQCQLFISFVTFALKTDFHTCNILLFLVAAPCSKMAPAPPNFCTTCKFQSSGGSLIWAEWVQKLVQNVLLQ